MRQGADPERIHALPAVGEPRAQNGAHTSPTPGTVTHASGLLLDSFTRPPASVVQLLPVGQYCPATVPSSPLLPIFTLTVPWKDP